MTHTPLPWEFVLANSGPRIQAGKIGEHIVVCAGFGGNRDNGRLIVRAVNCHDDLLAALEACVAWMEFEEVEARTIKLADNGDKVRVQARAAIAKAKGDET